MVHQTINSSTSSANKASSKINPMYKLLTGLIVGSLVACSTPPVRSPVALPAPHAPAGAAVPPAPAQGSDGAQALPPPREQSKSRWVAVQWSELPGLEQDILNQAWPAWLQSCSRPNAMWAALCQEVKRQADKPNTEQMQWLMRRFQAFRVESLSGVPKGLLTSYYEPVLEASRIAKPGFSVPLYAPPAGLKARSPWYSRQEMEQLPEAKKALRGREIAFVADPVDAMILHIQGSGQLMLTEADGSRKQIRLAFAATNEQPYQSIGRWLLDQGLSRDATWPGIKAWIAQNPRRQGELLWRNPRVVFFKEEPLGGLAALHGPKGAQGVPLTTGRSIAVDPGSIPYGTPVWLFSQGPQTQLARLVLAQDTGSAIQGAVRADYFAGSGAAAGELAGRLKQDLQLWVLLPR